MITLYTLLFFGSLSFIQQISAQNYTPRVFTGCAVLNTNVYCYGGYLGARGGQFISANTDHYTVDLSTTDMTVMKPTLNWKPVQPPAANQPPALEPRANFPITAIDQNRYVILGGATTNATLNTPAILYDSSKNAWQALADPPFYMSNGAMASSSDTVWAYGGSLNSTNVITPPNTLILDLTSLPGTWSVRANSGAKPGLTRHGHAAVIRNSQIYYIGGFFATSATQSTPVPMNQVSFYNTISDQWGTIFCEGDNPNNRTSHTATLISNSSKVLIYGGTGTDLADVALPLLDYAYLWDLDGHKYVKLNTTPGDPGPRMGHSAFQYNDTILISFGMDSSGNLRNDTTLLDVSIPASPVWVGTRSSNTNPSAVDNSSNNTGAIAGGVVGGVAGIAIIAGAFFYYQRRKKNQLRNDFDLYQPPQGFHTDDSPTLFTSSNDNRYSDVGNNSLGGAASAMAPGSTAKENNNTSLEMYSTDPAPNYHHIKPDESGHLPSHDGEPLSRVKPSAND